MKKSNSYGWIIFSGFLALIGLFAWETGCKKSDSPLCVYAPFGADVPTQTSTPSTGSINCYVFDESPKQGVSIILVDPVGNTVGTNTTNQYGNALFNPYPLVIGVYKAVVSPQGRYGFSALPITVTSSSQGPVSIQFWAGNQALTVVSGAPASFGSGTGAFAMPLAYAHPGTLDVPITVTRNTSPAAWTNSPATFVLSKSRSEEH